MRKLISLTAMLLALVACSSIDCPVYSKVEAHYFIYNSDGTALKLTDTLSVNTKRSRGLDTLIYNQGVGVSDFYLPMSYSHPEDILEFTFFNGADSFRVVDTVWVKKDDIPHFESVDCNVSFFHRLTSVEYTTHHIDSLVISNPSVTNDQTTEHFRLYPKVRN